MMPHFISKTSVELVVTADCSNLRIPFNIHIINSSDWCFLYFLYFSFSTRRIPHPSREDTSPSYIISNLIAITIPTTPNPTESTSALRHHLLQRVQNALPVGIATC